MLHHRATVHPARRTLASSNTQIRDRPIAIPDLIASAHAARDSESQRLVRGGMRMTLPAAEQHERQHGNHHDAGADGAHRLLGALAPEPLCAFVWGSMLSSIKRGDPRCETLFALLRRTLYEPPFA